MARKSNFELLRIISMVMIVGLHYFEPNMGGAMGQLEPTDFNFYITYLCESLFIVGVNCFILITGYFQINKTSIGLNKIFGLLTQMFFYGGIFYLIATATGNLPLSILEAGKAMFPFFIGLRWFIKIYILLYLLIPFINAGLNSMNKKSYLTFIAIMLIFFSVWPSFLPGEPVTDRGYGIITFVLMYAIGGYIRLFYTATRPKSFYFSGYLLSCLIIFASIVLSYLFIGGFGVMRMLGYNFIFNIFGSIFLFLFFSKLDITSEKINRIASFTLGVYFVHSDPSLNNILYNDILQTDKFWFSDFFIAHFLISVIFVYILSTIIDMCRKWFFDNIGKHVVPILKKRIPFIWKQLTTEP